MLKLEIDLTNVTQEQLQLTINYLQSFLAQPALAPAAPQAPDLTDEKIRERALKLVDEKRLSAPELQKIFAAHGVDLLTIQKHPEKYADLWLALERV